MNETDKETARSLGRRFKEIGQIAIVSFLHGKTVEITERKDYIICKIPKPGMGKLFSNLAIGAPDKFKKS